MSQEPRVGQFLLSYTLDSRRRQEEHIDKLECLGLFAVWDLDLTFPG